MAETRRPGKKTIREKLKRQRKRMGGQKLVFPNEQLASIVGPEARPRIELARHLHVYAEERGLFDPAGRIVHANQELIPLFWGRQKIRQSDLMRVVTYHVRLPSKPPTIALRLTGKPTTPLRPRPRPQGGSRLTGNATTTLRPRPKR